jgi:hypothetical protein
VPPLLESWRAPGPMEATGNASFVAKSNVSGLMTNSI